jgi:hypothetical protein
VHDCEHHLGHTLAQSTWHDPDAWFAYASKRLRPGADSDLFAPDGSPRF